MRRCDSSQRRAPKLRCRRLARFRRVSEGGAAGARTPPACGAAELRRAVADLGARIVEFDAAQLVNVNRVEDLHGATGPRLEAERRAPASPPLTFVSWVKKPSRVQRFVVATPEIYGASRPSV